MNKEKKKGNGSRDLASEHLFTALISLMNHKSFEDITISEICDKAGYSRMAYYRNYKDKSEILTKHSRIILESLKKEILKNPDDVGPFERIYNGMLADSVIKKITDAKLLVSFASDLKDLILFVEEKVFHRDLKNPEVVLDCYTKAGKFIGWVFYALYSGQKADVRKLLEEEKMNH